MLQARHYICNSEGSRAAAVEAEPGGVVPSERAEVQVRSDRATGAGELVKFGELVLYYANFALLLQAREAAGREASPSAGSSTVNRSRPPRVVGRVVMIRRRRSKGVSDTL
jgi:hypothetical protein